MDVSLGGGFAELEYEKWPRTGPLTGQDARKGRDHVTLAGEYT